MLAAVAAHACAVACIGVVLRAPPGTPSTISFVAKGVRPSDDTAAASALPRLLFLPGIDGTGDAGDSQWQRLSDQFDVCALSFDAADRSTCEECISAITNFLRAEAPRATLLLGESTGAVFALSVAAREPDLVDALCLVNPATSYERSALSKVAPLLPLLPRPLYDACPALVTPLFGKPQWFRSIIPSDKAPPMIPTLDDVRSISEQLAAVLPPDALAWRLEEHLKEGARRVNRALDDRTGTCDGNGLDGISTLLLAGGRDVILPSVAETERLTRDMPAAVRKVLPNAAHACLTTAARSTSCWSSI